MVKRKVERKKRKITTRIMIKIGKMVIIKLKTY